LAINILGPKAKKNIVLRFIINLRFAQGGYFNHLESIYGHNDKKVQVGTPMTVHLEDALMY
jgi:hypothetical protein